MAQASKDENRIPTLLGVSSADGKTPVTLFADPTTHRLYVDLAAGGTTTVDAGTTTTGEAGTEASVVNSGTTSDAIFDFTIPKGDKGDTGNGIASIAKTGTSGLTDTYTITFTDETTTTFDVTNGENGDQGDAGRGIVSIEKTNTVGLVDTYTITYTDSTTSTFDVTNGEDGIDGVSFTPKGAYNALTEYVANDVVSYLGSTWIALQTTTGNIPQEGAYWTLNASKGADGEGVGDMLASVYDPTSVGGDAFDMDNMAQGTTNKFLSSAELTVVQNTSGTNTGDQESTDFDIKDLTDSTNLRTTWSGKQDALGFTPEDITNKSTTLDTDKASDTKYPSVKSVYDWAVGLFQTLANKVTSFQVTPDDSHYPSEKLVKDSLDLKAPLASPTFTGTVTLADNARIDLTLPTADTYVTGNTTDSFASGYSSAVGDLVFFGSGGKWLEVDADAVATCNGLLGIALEAKADTEAMKVALPGSFVRLDSWNWNVGATLYAGETLGAIQETIPTGADAIIRVIGFAVTADVVFFMPSSDQQSTVA